MTQELSSLRLLAKGRKSNLLTRLCAIINTSKKFVSINIVLITISDTRDLSKDDKSGDISRRKESITFWS